LKTVGPATRFWLHVLLITAIALAALTGIGCLVWQNLPPELQESARRLCAYTADYLVVAFFFILIVLGFGLDILLRVYILPLSRMAEETTLIFSSNPSYRLESGGVRAVATLSRTINEWADRFQDQGRSIEERIAQARLETETEKNILASIMAELPQGVLICNISGRIILYNRQAKQIFARQAPTLSAIPAQDRSERYVGLGRSIFNLIDKNLIVHAINETQERLSQGRENMASYFIAPIATRSLYRFETVPILDRSRTITGFILIFREITEEIVLFKKTDAVMETFARDAESLVYDLATCMEEGSRNPGRASLSELQEKLTARSREIQEKIRNIANLFREKMDSEWPVIPLTSEKLFETLQKKAGFRYGIRVDVMGQARGGLFHVEPYSFTTAFMFVLQKLAAGTGSEEFELLLSQGQTHSHIDIAWEGIAITGAMLDQWKIQLVVTDDDCFPCSLNDIIKLHHGEITMLPPDAGAGRPRIRISLEDRDTVQSAAVRKAPIITQSRPEFYDFNLYDRNGEDTELMQTDLSRLTYTVFDTGGIRIVNARVQYNETFEHLVDPRRHVPAESVRIHGITDEILKGKLPVERVLPGFRKFAEDTVLLGHNVAFDMKMLQKNEARTGISFTQPVLDTLLLSAVVHPLQTTHTMEAIASRLGVDILGRHTALGDAISTAEIFLRLLPLLNKKGIIRLRDAVAASKRTYFARLKY
jgi:DNA polymerase-3 subunit epsilon